MQNFSFHTHTNTLGLFDGHNSISEMIDAAYKAGYKELGISNHMIYHPNMHTSSEAQKNDKMFHADKQKAKEIMSAVVEEIREKAKTASIKVYAGFEVDYFPLSGWMDEFREFKQKIDVDYLINGNHQVTSEDGTEVYEIYHFQRYGLSESKIKELFHNHFSNIRKAIESDEFSFLAHIDFARWSGVIGEYDFAEEIKGIVTALKEHNMPTEINTKGKNSIGSFYPARWIIEELVKNDIPLVISDDAHSVSQLGQYFDEAESLLSQLHATKRWSL